MSVGHNDTAVQRALLSNGQASFIESAGAIEAKALDRTDPFGRSGPIDATTNDPLEKTQTNGPVSDSTSSISRLFQRSAEIRKVGSGRPCFAPLRKTKREPLRVVEWLIERRNERHDPFSDALLDGDATVSEGG